MIGLVLVTHGRLAVEFRSALEHVVGPQTQIEAVTIGPDDDVEQRRKDIIEAVKRVDTGEGVAILTDMFGGTPSNLAISCMGRPNVEVLAGINMPMLVKLAKVREECPLAGGGRRGAGRRPQIRHHRQPRARREMSDDRGGRSAGRRVEPTADADRPRARNRQQEGPARARLGQVRADGRALRRRRDGHARQRDRRRHLDHGPDDAGRRRPAPRSRSRPPAARPPRSIDALAKLRRQAASAKRTERLRRGLGRRSGLQRHKEFFISSLRRRFGPAIATREGAGATPAPPTPFPNQQGPSWPSRKSTSSRTSGSPNSAARKSRSPRPRCPA